MKGPTVERSRELLAAARERPVLVVGDAMLDRFLWGEVERISPEAPVPVVRVQRESVHLGGAANVAANLAALGVPTTLAAVAARDAAGNELRAELARSGIAEALVDDPQRATIVKTRIIARAQQVVRVDRENPGPLSGETVSRLAEVALAALERSAAVVVSDYRKGAVAEGVVGPILAEAARRGLPVVVDPKPAHFDRYQPATIVTPNQGEAALAAGIEIESDEDCLEAARRLLARIRIDWVLVTRGERGMLLVGREGAPEAIPAAAREVYDVTGAGDTVVATVAPVLAAGGTPLEAAVLANHAAGIVVGKVGTATAGPAEILDRLGRAGGSTS